MSGDPTLKVRFDMTGYNSIGRSCHSLALDLVNGRCPLAIPVDAKWGRPLDKWIQDGKDWGGGKRPQLTQWQRGYIAALSPTTPREETLLNIIGALDKK